MKRDTALSARKKSPGFREILSQKGVYNVVAGSAVLTSAIWFFTARRCEDAGRGGACAVAISFFLLFLRRNYGERVLETALRRTEEIRRKMKREHEIEVFTDLESKQLLLALVGWVNTEADAQERQNISLFISSVVGTLVWGFADIFWARGQQFMHALHLR